jgi:hypothetical protein
VRRLVLLILAVAPLAASAATPPEGVALTVRRGFFTETDIGGFMTVGGDDGYSNLQTYLQLGIGYDIGKNISLGLHYGTGANAANCFNGKLEKDNSCTASDNFTVSFIDLTVSFLFQLAERFYISPKLAGGWTTLDPAPILIAVTTGGCKTVADQSDPAKCTAVRQGPNAGAGVGIEYATYMDHFSVGVDVLARYVIGPNIISLQFFPRVKYTF